MKEKLVRFPDSLADRIEQLAERHHRSFNAEVVHALEEYSFLYPKEEDKIQAMQEEISTTVEVTREEMTHVIRSRLPDTPYEFYSFIREENGENEIGYIGMTSIGIEERIKQHLNKVEALRDPFLQWLKEGMDTKTLRYGKIAQTLGYGSAQKIERELIRKNKPLFNKTENTLRSIQQADMSFLRLPSPNEETNPQSEG